VSDSCASTLGKGTSLEPIAVAFDQAGGVILQSREPSALVLDNGVRVPLGEESRRDTGLALFYMDVGTGYSCASCHPGGADDGLVWQAFAVAAPRRTPSLEGHGARRGPYFWAGDMDTFEHLAEFLLVDRLGLAPAPSPQQIDSLQAWLMTLPAPAPDPDLDAQSVERGRARFAALACDSCHAGDEWSDYALHDVGTGGTFRTPSLIGVALRAPYFHDGCASSLSGVFGACGGGPAHEVGVDVDLVEFLRSL
jgi:mono/diheme cytochrome c family protein